MTDKNPQKINKMFDEIAQYYDKMNNLMSLGLHNVVKKEALKLLSINKFSMVIDLCCGSGDFTKIIKKLYPTTKIIGLDNSINMLKLAKTKNPNEPFILGDCTDIPFKQNEFDFVTIGFGLRNIENRTKALNEIYRILKPEGKFLHLDFGKHNLFSKIFDFIVLTLIKFNNINSENYRYLINSKNNYPEPSGLIQEFEKIGFKFSKRKDFLFGVISAQVMTK